MSRRSAWRVSASVGLILGLAGSLHPSQAGRSTAGALPPAPSRYLPHPGSGGLAAAELSRLSLQSTQKVIILLRDQQESAQATETAAARAAIISSEQSPILHELAQAQATRVKAFALINAVAATVSSAEVAQLTANPAVRAVVPDLPLALPRPPALPPRTTTAQATMPAQTAPQACSRQPLLEPEALQITQAAFADPSVPQAQNIATGKGVTVAVIGFPFDPNNPDLIRPDGSHVVVDYQDFGGDGPGRPEGASGEGFGDATDVVAQGNVTYNLNDFINSFYTQSAGCPQLIKIRGMAPGASLIGVPYVGPNFFFSTAVEAIQYAATHGANVLSESFIINRYPDDSNNPINLANDAAVRAGVTVVGSSGDAGSVNTIGNPETDPNIIAVGATTSFRLYQQTHFFSPPNVSTAWVNNNLSSFSSGGFSQADLASPHGPRVPDVVAPGDLGWALCSTNVAIYFDCTDLNGKPSPIEIFGGTSMSAPLTAGEAALVIQAYRDSHNGDTPAPALVKQIIMNSATDLDTPADQQGAGLINALKAVELARGIGAPAPLPTAESLLSVSPTSFGATDAPKTPESFTVSVTNNGKSLQVLRPELLTDSAPLSAANYTRTLNPARDAVFPGIVGQPLAYRVQNIYVPVGAQRLSVAIAYNIIAHPNTIVQLLLYDQFNRFVAFSNPQGVSGFGSVTVHNPWPGVYHAYLVTDAPHGYAGPVHLSVNTTRDMLTGTVFPRVSVVLPGRTVQFSVSTTTPAQPGDRSERLVFAGRSAGEPDALFPLPTRAGSIPVALRSTVPLGPTGGTITGTLTGGNGRAGNNAQPIQTYEFTVPPGLSDLDLNFGIGDSGYNLSGYLIDPTGIQRDVQSTVTAVDTNPALSNGQPNPHFGLPTAFTNAMQFFLANPQPGLWRFVLSIDITISGRQTSLPFTAAITFNGAQVQPQAPMPNSPSTVLQHGTPITVPIRITNTGSTLKAFFVDPRLAGTTTYDLGGVTGGPLPGISPVSFIPTHSSNIVSLAESHDPTVPTNLEMLSIAGQPLIDPQNAVTLAPDVLGRRGVDPVTGNDISIVETGSQTTDGPWLVIPTQIGPFPIGGETPSVVDVATMVTTQPFDSQVVPDSGDLMAVLAGQANPFSFNPLLLAPGQSGVINVTITPTAAVGTTVSGTLYVAAFNGIPLSTDELAAIHYTYTVG